MLLSDDDREKILSNIAGIMTSKLTAKELTEEQARDISREVLLVIDDIATHEEAHEYLDGLSQKYPMFSDLAVLEGGVLNNAREKDAYQDATRLIKSGDIDQALNQLKAATNN